ncbi:MAG: hypothetical protein PHX01_08055 [Clostridia bacterium]|nr:hypothetical protein [Clostridia bacterium]
MKLIDGFNKYKLKYEEYVLLIKFGIFCYVYNDDVSVIYSFFKYKIKNKGDYYEIGFPKSSLVKICKSLGENKNRIITFS